MDRRHQARNNILRQARRAAYAKATEKKKARVLALLILLQLAEAQRQWWVHPLNNSRDEDSEFYHLYPQLRHWKNDFFAMYRMYPSKFDQLLAIIGPRLRKKTTNMREPISPEMKLVLTLT